jgi:hypothetical protein
MGLGSTDLLFQFINCLFKGLPLLAGHNCNTRVAARVTRVDLARVVRGATRVRGHESTVFELCAKFIDLDLVVFADFVSFVFEFRDLPRHSLDGNLENFLLVHESRFNNPFFLFESF